jgi:hypothetical protein
VSRIVRMTCLCLLGAFALAACGGDSQGGASGPQKETGERADRICRDAQRKVGDVLGDDAAADRDAVRAATDQLMGINPPSENETTWELFVQSHNNLWIVLEDIAQSLDPNVNDRARADRARTTLRTVHDNVKRYATDYEMEICSQGYGEGDA